jgi:hypothetical protein
MRVECLRKALAIGRYTLDGLEITNKLGNGLFLQELGEFLNQRLILGNLLSL